MLFCAFVPIDFLFQTERCFNCFNLYAFSWIRSNLLSYNYARFLRRHLVFRTFAYMAHYQNSPSLFMNLSETKVWPLKIHRYWCRIINFSGFWTPILNFWYCLHCTVSSSSSIILIRPSFLLASSSLRLAASFASLFSSSTSSFRDAQSPVSINRMMSTYVQVPVPKAMSRDVHFIQSPKWCPEMSTPETRLQRCVQRRLLCPVFPLSSEVRRCPVSRVVMSI